MKYTFTYKDSHSRKNKAERFGDNEYLATEKSRLLYPDTTILEIHE